MPRGGVGVRIGGAAGDAVTRVGVKAARISGAPVRVVVARGVDAGGAATRVGVKAARISGAAARAGGRVDGATARMDGAVTRSDVSRGRARSRRRGGSGSASRSRARDAGGSAGLRATCGAMARGDFGTVPPPDECH
jgi:hypothetical protein